MRNAICSAHFWMNKLISPMPPSYGGPYITAVCIVLLRTAIGRPYFIIGAVIT